MVFDEKSSSNSRLGQNKIANLTKKSVPQVLHCGSVWFHNRLGLANSGVPSCVATRFVYAHVNCSKSNMNFQQGLPSFS